MQGSFVSKRGSTWTAYYYVPALDGDRRQRSKGGFHTKKEAQAWLNKAMAAAQAGEYVEPTKLTFGDYLLNRWLPLQESAIRPTTWDSYHRVLTLHVVPRLGKVPLQAVSADQLDRLYTDLLKTGRLAKRKGVELGTEGLSPKTVRYIHNTISKALKDAERKSLVVRNVATAADPPRLRQSGSNELRTWTAAELRAFLMAMKGQRLEAAFILAATTGMRRGEVLGLRWRDVAWTDRRLAVRQSITSVNYKILVGTPKTARGRRSIALDPATLDALEQHRQRQEEERIGLGTGYHDNDLVFPKLDGTPINPDLMSQVFDRNVAKLPLPRIRLHDLRHTHATLGLAAGVPPKVMSDRLGHATVAFTQDVYMHAIPQLEEKAAEQVADLIFGNS